MDNLIRYIGIAARIILGVFATIVSIGAFLSDEYRAGVSFLILALYTTVSADFVKSKFEANYWLLLCFLLIVAFAPL